MRYIKYNIDFQVLFDLKFVQFDLVVSMYCLLQYKVFVGALQRPTAWPWENNGKYKTPSGEKLSVFVFLLFFFITHKKKKD